MRLKSALRRGVAAAVIAGIAVSSGSPAYAGTWDIADGDITVKAGGNGVVLTTTATGASATITFASAPTTEDATDASDILGLTSASGATVTAGSAGASEDTVLLTGARFLGTFTAGEAPCNNIALVELL